MSFFLHNPLLSPVRVFGLGILTRILAARNLTIVSASDVPERRPFYDLLKETRSKTDLVLQDGEAYSVYSAARETEKIPGVIAEVGVFRGGSACLIAASKGDRKLHLFDTFAGLPETSQSHDPDFRAGTFQGSLESVSNLLKDVPNVHFHKGLFPDTAAGLEDLRFSFVHLDVDLYDSTRNCLAWFYPRMSQGALLISHDFVNAEGVRKAFREFFADKPEVLFELTGTQVAFIRSGCAAR